MRAAAARLLQEARAGYSPRLLWFSLRFAGSRNNEGVVHSLAHDYLAHVCEDPDVGGQFPHSDECGRLAFDLAASAALSDEAAP